MSSKIDVVICLGSSCFSRGNKGLLKAINQFVNDNNIQDRIHFRGGHCFGNCAEGPILKVKDQVYTQVDEQKMLEILISAFEV